MQAHHPPGKLNWLSSFRIVLAAEWLWNSKRQKDWRYHFL